MRTMKFKILYTVLCLASFLVAFPVQVSADIVEIEQSGRIVKGTITDALGEPLPGVSITVKGTSSGTITGLNGEYSVPVTGDNTVLQISYIGYVTQEITVGSRATIDVVLQEDNQVLDEVVVVGYGVQKKANLTGSVSSVNFEDQAMSRPITNVSSALAGLSSGVQVMQTSGRPGEDGANIRIRGFGTLNDNNPLVIIDGMEGSMDAVNPQDIESISILKDAASSSIYGARAAGGVILITTKKGQKGKVNVNYSGRVSWARPSNLIDFVSDYASYMEWFNEARNNIGQSNLFKQETIDLWREKAKDPNGKNDLGVPNYVAFPNTNWQDALFENGKVIDHNVSVNGGSENARYLLSVGYLNNEGLVQNTGVKRYSFRTNLESNVTKWLTVGANIFATQEDKDPGNFGDANNYLRQTTPGLYPYWNGKVGYPEAPEESATANNPFFFLNNTSGDIKKTRFNGTIYSKVDLYKGLSWDFNFNYNRRWDEERTWTNAANAEKVRHSDGYVASKPTSPTEMTSTFYDYSDYTYTMEHILRYNTTINRDHDISALLGFQEYYHYEQYNTAQKKGFMDPTIPQPSTVVNMNYTYGNATDLASRSWFGRVNYAYQSKYLFEANFRRDRISRYASDERTGIFPSFSGGWRITEEAFMAGTRNFLDNLKLRVSWGQVGNAGGNQTGRLTSATSEANKKPGDNYEYQRIYGQGHYSLNGQLLPGLRVLNINNPYLTWETTTLTNIGIDANLFRNRLSFELEFYDKTTEDILYRPAMSPTMGLKTAPRQNIAEVKNRGIEVSLGWNDRINDVTYSVSGNFSYNHNEVTKYLGAYEEGWKTNSITGKEEWANNIKQVTTNGSLGVWEKIAEGYKMYEHYLKDVYKGSGTYFNADNTVNIHGGPKDGMIRTKEDMEWVNAMKAAGYTFMPNNNVRKNGLWYGDYIYADYNGDGIYGSDFDEHFQGTSRIPKYNFGLQASAAWKGFDLSMNWAGAAGFHLYWGASTGLNSPAMRHGLALPQDIADNHYFYDPDNADDPRTNLYAKYGRLVASESGYANVARSSLYLFKGDYLKLKNLTIGYTIPANISRRAMIEKVRVYVSGENLLTITDFPGQDPEMGASPGYTSMRQFAIGVNVTF